MIYANVSTAGRLSTGSMYSSMQDFNLLKSFKIVTNPTKPLIIKQVDWHSLPGSWVKCNTDWAAKGNLGIAACGVIFRDANAAALGCFAENIGVSFAINAELIGAM